MSVQWNGIHRNPTFKKLKDLIKETFGLCVPWNWTNR